MALTPASFKTHVMTEDGRRVERAEDDRVILNPTFGRRRWGAPRGIVVQAAPMTIGRRIAAYIRHNRLTLRGSGTLTRRQVRQLNRMDRPVRS